MKINNSNTKKLDTDDINITTQRNITTISQPVETIAIDPNGNVDPISIEYNKYRDDINNIYQTNLDGSLITSEFTVDEDICNHSMVVRKLNGDRKEVLNNTFSYSDGFRKNFLTAVLKDFSSRDEILEFSLIQKENNTSNILIISKDNNTLEIKNIDTRTANQLKNLITDRPNNLNNNQKGIGNYLVIILTILLITIILIGIIYFTIKTAK